PALATVTGATAAANTGAFGDVDAGDIVTLSASPGAVTSSGTRSGTWAWSQPDATANETVTITATDSHRAASSTPSPVQPLSPPAALTAASPTLSPAGQTVTFTATVTPAAAGAPTPTGSVTFSVDGTQTTVPLSAGQAPYSATFTTVGTHTVA